MDNRMTRWRNRHREQGLCQNCSEPAAPNRSLCLKHLTIAKNPKKSKAWRDEHLGTGTCTQCSNPAEPGYKLCSTHRSVFTTRGSLARQTIKQEVINHYGGKCACCGESHPSVLCIDHINNNGTEHRKSIGGGSAVIYRWLKNNNYPEGFQLLCFNCN